MNPYRPGKIFPAKRYSSLRRSPILAHNGKLRDIEELTTAETAAVLELSENNVKVRLHRAHGMLRSWLFERIGTHAKEAFPFMGVRCDRVVQGVFERLAHSVAATQ